MKKERKVEELRQHRQQGKRADETRSAHRVVLIAGEDTYEPYDGQENNSDRPMREEEDPVHGAQLADELISQDARQYPSHVVIVILPPLPSPGFPADAKPVGAGPPVRVEVPAPT